MFTELSETYAKKSLLKLVLGQIKGIYLVTNIT